MPRLTPHDLKPGMLAWSKPDIHPGDVPVPDRLRMVVVEIEPGRVGLVRTNYDPEAYLDEGGAVRVHDPVLECGEDRGLHSTLVEAVTAAIREAADHYGRVQESGEAWKKAVSEYWG
jgi:hypothetical protein